MGKGASGEVPCREIAFSLFSLLNNYWLYFDKYEYLNSDGRKFIARLSKEIMRKCPEARPSARRVLREPNLDNIIRLLEVLFPSLAYEFINNSSIIMYGPVVWRLRERYRQS